MEKNVGQQSYKLGSYSYHISLVNIRLAAGINISVLSAKGADKEPVCQSVTSPVMLLTGEVRDTLRGRVTEHI